MNLENSGSFADFLNTGLTEQTGPQLVKTQIDELVNSNLAMYDHYFNFKLNPTTWRLIVNKQILMKYERLFIEKQLNERKQKENDLNKQIASLDAEA